MNKTAVSGKSSKKEKKPLRLAGRWGRQVPGLVGKLVVILIAIVAMGLMFSALQVLESAWLRMSLSLIIIAGILLLCFGDGLTTGVRDADASRFYTHLEKEGHTPSAQDDSACYHPLKALCAALLVFGIPLAIAVYLAVTAKPYTYVLQDLPLWLTDNYASRSDIMGPLGAYTASSGMVVKDWLRMAVRLTELVYVNLFSDPQIMVQQIDRLSPLFVASYPIAYLIGYLCGPAQSAKRQAQNRRAKKIAARRAQKNKVADELLDHPKQVHYGHRQEEEKKRKKELV